MECNRKPLGINWRTLICCFCLLLFLPTWGAPAYPGLIEFIQPDGTKVIVRMHGDEDLKWAESEDGYTLVFDPLGFLSYGQLDDKGNLVPSTIHATAPDQRNQETLSLLQKVGKGLSYSKLQIEQTIEVKNVRSRDMAPVRNSVSRKTGSNNNYKTPIVGQRQNLLLLVDFPDRPFTRSKTDFEELMNREHSPVINPIISSVKDYFREASFGQLDLQTTVLGIYRMSQPVAYYGSNNHANARQMVLEALEQADADIDFSKFDNDGDGIVDGVHIIYAGYGEEAGGGEDCIWAHASSVRVSHDGVSFQRYSCSPELRSNFGSNRTNIGVICHELAHVFGTMDFYDTNYAIEGQYPATGNWDLMAGGNWNNEGASPAMPNPYSTIYDFGWSDVILVDSPTTLTLQPHAKDHYVRINTTNEGEFFLLENRQKTGFDMELPGHGLLIYHASENLSKRNNNTINSTHPQQFYIVSANAPVDVPNSMPSSYGKINDASCPFPGSGQIQTFSDYTLPSMKSWSGIETGLPITEITEDMADNTVSFVVGGGGYNGAYQLKINDTGNDFISLTWSTTRPGAQMMLLANSSATFGTPMEETYALGDKIEGGGEVVFIGNELSFTHSGLASRTDYYYSVYTWDEQAQRWFHGGIKRVRTLTGVIRQFSYKEDFETKILDESWTQEQIMGDSEWRPESKSSVNFLQLWTNGSSNEVVNRLVSPVFDFTGIKQVLLQFDYNNGLDCSYLYYRKSPTDSWHLLHEMEHEHWNVYMDRHVDVVLDDLSDQYQLSFLCMLHRKNGGFSSSGEVFNLDDIKISTEEDGVVYFDKIKFCSIASNSIEIETKASTLSKEIIEQGVALFDEWGTAIKTCKKPTAVNIWSVTELTPSKKYFIKPYAQTSDGIFYGETQQFTARPEFKGQGTAESPYLIEDNADWTSFQIAINGCDTEGWYFELKNDLIVTGEDRVSGFSGIFEGNGHTIHYNVSGTYSMNGLFAQINETGIVRNLKIDTETMINHIGSPACVVALRNLGIIENVKVSISGTFDVSNSYEGNNWGVGGLVGINNGGIIRGCEVDYQLDEAQINPESTMQWGGICHTNYGTGDAVGIIIDCCTRGFMAGSEVGGIVHTNNTGIVRNCINYATILSTDYEPKSAGIVYYNIGAEIDCCVNYGELRNRKTAGIVYTAGTYLSKGSSITNCYNAGRYTASPTQWDYNEWNRVAGIVGNCQSTTIDNCLFLGSVEDWKNEGDCCVISYYVSEGGNLNHGYYLDYYTDPRGTKISMKEVNSQDFVHELNKNAMADLWVLSDGHLRLRMEDKKMVSVPVTTMKINEIRDTQVALEVVTGGIDAEEISIEFKKANELKWRKANTASGHSMQSVIRELDPFELYDIRAVVTVSGIPYASGTTEFVTNIDRNSISSDTILIPDYTSLLKFALLSSQQHNFEGQVIKLTSDIDLGGAEGRLWQPITSNFMGELDGGGHTIHNMRVVVDGYNAGFFATTGVCMIHDLHFDNAFVESRTIGHISGGNGTGGIIGYAGYNGIGSTIQRCSYTGTLKAGDGTYSGAIAGAISLGSVQDCYANAVILNSGGNSGFFSGRIVGSGSVINSYFVGSRFQAIWENGTAGYQEWYSDHVENSHYLSDVSSGEKMTEEDMKSGVLLSKLDNTVWMADDAVNPINHGYPILRNRSMATMSSQEAYQDAYGRYLLRGIYTRGIDRQDCHFGIEWWYYDESGQKVLTTVAADNPDSILTIVKDMSVDIPYFYRAFAIDAANDTIYGDQVTFKRLDPNPCPFVEKVVSDNLTGNAILTYGINTGDDVIREMNIAYYQKSDPANVLLKSAPLDKTQVALTDLVAQTQYSARLIATGYSGQIYESESVTWITPEAVGDVNGNGSVDKDDISTLVAYLLGRNPRVFIKSAADLNADGKISVADITALIIKLYIKC